MLLNAELIDKLMNNKTLVNLMSSQLKRVIDTDRMDELEKRRIVRQVFDQMMEEKVDFSMNNVRLAVKTVSSSYRAAAEKQRKMSDTNHSSSSSNNSQAKLSKVKQNRPPVSNSAKPSMVTSFGKRGVSSTESSFKDGVDQSRSENSNKQSKSFQVIDTALKLTKQANQQQETPVVTSSSTTSGKSQRQVALESNSGSVKKKNKKNQAAAGGKSASGKLDASGNPIVVVLLPQDKA